MLKVAYVDSHCHLYEYSESDVEDFTSYFLIAAVSDDIYSSLKTLTIASKYSNVIPCIGIHPWEVGNTPKEHIGKIVDLISKYEVKCLGEIGLDRRFVPETIDRQREFFIQLLQIAQDYDLTMNIHAVNTWAEVLGLLRKYDIERAIFHWYTGPLDLIDEIVDAGYYISINPAYTVQEKHRKVIHYADLEYIVTESDGPYNYRGLKLNPKMIKETVKYIAEIKGLNIEKVRNIIYENFKKIFIL